MGVNVIPNQVYKNIHKDLPVYSSQASAIGGNEQGGGGKQYDVK